MRVPSQRFLRTVVCLVCLGVPGGTRLCAAETGRESQSPEAPPARSLSFQPAADGGYEFDTGVLRGRLRPGGQTLGLCSVVHTPSGVRLDRSNGLFSHYRVFTRNHRYGGGAWDWPSTARLRGDGAVEVRWPAAEGRPFALRAIYRWSKPGTLDLETIVTAHAELPQFESFLASYFSEPFTNSLVFVKPSAAAPGAARFQAAIPSAGEWQMFPRDGAVVSLITDGRWTLDPNPVRWTIGPAFGQPLGLRRAPGLGLTAVLMAPSQDCFALATPQQAETHRSFYLSLFGRTIKAGETARARARLVLGTELSDLRALDLDREYLEQSTPNR